MKRKEAPTPQKEPTIEYIVVEDEFNNLDEIFDEIFEQVEKEINHAKLRISIDKCLQMNNSGE